jgi:hypothetical protein
MSVSLFGSPPFVPLGNKPAAQFPEPLYGTMSINFSAHKGAQK